MENKTTQKQDSIQKKPHLLTEKKKAKVDRKSLELNKLMKEEFIKSGKPIVK